MSQSKLGSFMESVTNILIGYTVAVASQMLIFSRFGVHLSHAAHFEIGLFFTVISLVRSYLLRRWYNSNGPAAVVAWAKGLYLRYAPARRFK